MAYRSNKPAPQDPAARQRMLLIIWAVQLMSLGLFFLVSKLIAVPDVRAEGNDPLPWALLAAGVVTLLLSFVLKGRVLAQSVAQQDVGKVQAGYILAFVFCEMTALFGLVLYFTRGTTPVYYLLFALGALGMLLHMPRRAHLDEASFKQKGFGADNF